MPKDVNVCGVSFYFSKKQSYRSNLVKSLAVTRHRGPDTSNVYCKKLACGHVGLGHNRLSIIDTSALGTQPLRRKNVTISYNGEVYNYKEIRQNLESKGYTFISDTDTEVILIAFIEYGTASFQMLKGMFAFVILDENSKKIYIVRDTVGIKPIYIYKDGMSLFASSEIRGLKAFTEVNTSVSRHDIFEFFNQGFLYEPATGFEKIKKLLPGYYLTFDMQVGSSEYIKFGCLADFNDKLPLGRKIASSIKQQQQADVPVGAFFSGGVDSSIIATFSQDLSLIYAKYDDSPGSNLDLKYSSLISQHLNMGLITEKIDDTAVSKEAILQSFYFVADNTEELISDYTFWSTYLLSKAAKSRGFTVMLSGMGGDEGFGGYPRYFVIQNHNLIIFLAPLLKLMNFLRLTPKAFSKRFERLLSYANEKNWAVGYSRLLGYFSTHELRSLFRNFHELNPVFENKLDDIMSTYEGAKDKLKIAQHYDLTGFLSHNLMVSDKASMLASIELRVPLLDERVIRHGIATGSKELIKRGGLKYPLKLLLLSLLPKKLVNRPKAGFNPPLDGLINSLGKSFISKKLEPLSETLNQASVRDIVDTHFLGKKNNTYKIWQLLYFSRWLKTNDQ